jgi:hypothetical protein
MKSRFSFLEDHNQYRIAPLFTVITEPYIITGKVSLVWKIITPAYTTSSATLVKDLRTASVGEHDSECKRLATCPPS